jgi:biopolymer transport protein ExbD
MLLKNREELESPTINLTSMIDVLFLLIIFFMVGTRFNESERQINLNLPRVNGAAPMIAGPRNRTVAISRDGTTTLDGRVVSLQQLSTELSHAASQYPDIAVDVRSDGAVPLQKFSEVADTISAAGVTRLGLMTAQSHMPMRR